VDTLTNIGASSKEGEIDSDGVLRKDTLFTTSQSNPITTSGSMAKAADPLLEPPESIGGDPSSPTPAQKDVWGSPFPIEWLRTDSLSFTRTRHLRNPWNHDREVKVSRDGTELEPSVGEALLAEWEKMKTLTPPPVQTTED
jgi:hypothetical protein